MIKGHINNQLEPIIKISIAFDDKLMEFNAVIDTGFNGFISIPHQIINKTAWQFIGYESFELASGEIIRDKVYLGDIYLGNNKRYLYILSNKTKDILIGSKLLIDKILTINFKTKIVKIEDA